VVWHLSIFTAEENQRHGSEPTPGIVRGMLGTSAFYAPKLCNAALIVNGGLSPHVNNVKPTCCGEVAGKASHHAHDLEEECGAFVP
jgi:hypothetical protein